jgi:hypothetical protein
MPATAPILAKPETTLRFGDGGGNSPKPPKVPCKIYTFPMASSFRPIGSPWIRTVLRAATARANGTKQWPGSNLVGREAAIHHFDVVLKSKARNSKGHGVPKEQVKKEIDSLRAFFNEWLENHMPVTPDV